MKAGLKIVIVKCKEGGYFARVPSKPGCMTQADNWRKLLFMINDAIQAWDSAMQRPIKPKGRR